MAPKLSGSSHDVDRYLNEPYTIQVSREAASVFVASVLELPGCVTQAESWNDLGSMIEDAIVAWITSALDDGRPVPAPKSTVTSGRILVRAPRTLHGDLLRVAHSEGVSLNQLVVSLLSRGVGPRTTL